MLQGDDCSRGMIVLEDGCLGGWEFLIPKPTIYMKYSPIYFHHNHFKK